MLNFIPNTDDVIAPITHQLAAILTNQLGIGRVYEQAPDGPPEDQSIVIPPPTFKLMSDTNGKLALRLTFAIRYLVRRKRLADSISAAQLYLIPLIQAFSAWANQGLYDGTRNLAREVNAASGGVVQLVESGQAFIAAVCNVDVLVDLNINTSPS